MDQRDIIYSPDSHGDANTAVLKVCAQVSLRCKERLYSEEIRADQGQAGAPGNRVVQGDWSLIPGSVVSENDSSTIAPPPSLPVLAYAALECGCFWLAESA